MNDPNWPPAPWRTDADAGFPYDIHDADGEMICSVEASDRGEAIANLMAAAPCLYKALEELRAQCADTEAALGADRALAKARGEQS